MQNHMISGYGRVPLNQQRIQRPITHPQVQTGTECKFDSDMTLEEALTANWCLTNNDEQGNEGFRVADQSQSAQMASGQARRLMGAPTSIPALRTPRGNWTFSNPTDSQGEFARAMSQITCDPSAGSQGRVLSENKLNQKLFNQIQLALAVKMGLNGPQQVKEQALQNVLTSKSARGDMKQILQSRAEIYGDGLDPN